ncbi:MAG: nucleoside monophosphate kinase, partial [Candidatus Nanoarchaeia archaeon]
RIPNISMGELLRQLAEKSDYGRELKEKYWGKGILVPDDITMDVLQQELGKSFILDGFPRNINQAKMLDALHKVDLVISIKVSDKTIIQRISGRLQCQKCGAIYHIQNNPPKKDMVCDNDGTKLYVRADDKNIKAIKERIKIFKKQTMPVINHYRKAKVLREVDGERSIGIVFNDIMRIIRQKSRK